MLCSLFIAAIGLFGSAAPFAANDADEGGEGGDYQNGFPDQFRITAGGYAITRFDATTSLTTSNAGVGILIDPEVAFGLDLEQTVARVDGYWRFNERHALSWAVFSINTIASRTARRDFPWLNEQGNVIIVPAGSGLRSEFDYEVLKVGYRWSYYHTDEVELWAGLGLHTTRVKIDLRSDLPGVNPEKVDTTAPLPVVAVGVEYNITPRLSWGYRSEFFTLSDGDYDVNYTDSALSLNYRVGDAFAVGLGLGSSAFRLKEDDNRERLRFESQLTGLFLNASYHF
jgi:hypothetical protein